MVKSRRSSLSDSPVHGTLDCAWDYPQIFGQLLNRVRDVHSYSTRGSSTDFVPPRVKSNLGKESFLYVATSLWNRLLVNLKMIRSLGGFKQALKKWLSCQS